MATYLAVIIRVSEALDGPTDSCHQAEDASSPVVLDEHLDHPDEAC